MYTSTSTPNERHAEHLKHKLEQPLIANNLCMEGQETEEIPYYNTCPSAASPILSVEIYDSKCLKNGLFQ